MVDLIETAGSAVIRLGAQFVFFFSSRFFCGRYLPLPLLILFRVLPGKIPEQPLATKGRTTNINTRNITFHFIEQVNETKEGRHGQSGHKRDRCEPDTP